MQLPVECLAHLLCCYRLRPRQQVDQLLSLVVGVDLWVVCLLPVTGLLLMPLAEFNVPGCLPLGMTASRDLRDWPFRSLYCHEPAINQRTVCKRLDQAPQQGQ